MANDTYTIIYYDSADSAHTTALSDLTTAGGVDIGDGIVDGSAAYYATGIFDGTTYYATGIVCSEYNGTAITVAFPAGIIQSDGASWDAGIFDATTRYASGIFDGSTRYQEGTFTGFDGYNFTGIVDGTGNTYSSGILDTTSTYTAYGVFDGFNSTSYFGILYDNAGIPTYDGKGILSDDGVFHGSGILYYDGGLAQYIYAQYGTFDGTTYRYDGIMFGGVYHDYGIVSYNGGLATYDATGIYDGTTYYNSGIWDGSVSQIRYADGVWDGSNYFGLAATDSPPYIAGYDAAPQSDILGSGLL